MGAALPTPGLQPVPRDSSLPRAPGDRPWLLHFAAISLAVGILVLCVEASGSICTVCAERYEEERLHACGSCGGRGPVPHPCSCPLPCGPGLPESRDCCGHRIPPQTRDCSVPWAFHAASGGTVLTSICAVSSARADIAASRDKVQEAIEEGKSLSASCSVERDTNAIFPLESCETARTYQSHSPQPRPLQQQGEAVPG
ncbi:PREDICTED: lipoma HMGIC fusion partner-like 2 protein [Chinchilla lanigera]|uniref:lipoma HMGIC fusion partner-like 2 protein n=1 Tax=Chinchilla lanigera TaxID=34839 RepID=UPI000698F260|nr:PREDICTED: lipoma HMGIC fusion partner-like 2 protein [Chinchilla lanigera]